MQKQKLLARIHKFMRKHKISLGDLICYLSSREPDEQTTDYPIFDNEYDVLCIIDGKKMRLPFHTGRLFSPIGIFPFAQDNRYIELDEQEGKKHTDKDVDNSRLLDREFCLHLYKIKNRLNLYLKALKKPLLEGEYLADSKYMSDCGWIVNFNCGAANLFGIDYYGGNQPAKLRYSGTFAE